MKGNDIASLTLLATRGTEFLPPFNEGAAQVNVVLPPGTNLDTANLYGRRLEKIALAFVPPELAKPGNTVWVEIRGKSVEARTVALPFYKRA